MLLTEALLVKAARGDEAALDQFARLLEHAGPGPHPGTGSPQLVHGGHGRALAFRGDRALGEWRAAPAMGKRAPVGVTTMLSPGWQRARYGPDQVLLLDGPAVGRAAGVAAAEQMLREMDRAFTREGAPGRERMVIVAADGRPILLKEGAEHAVSTEGLVEKYGARLVGATLVHNHPVGTAMSTPDISAALDLGLAEIVAVAPQGQHRIRVNTDRAAWAAHVREFEGPRGGAAADKLLAAGDRAAGEMLSAGEYRLLETAYRHSVEEGQARISNLGSDWKAREREATVANRQGQYTFWRRVTGKGGAWEGLLTVAEEPPGTTGWGPDGAISMWWVQLWMAGASAEGGGWQY